MIAAAVDGGEAVGRGGAGGSGKGAARCGPAGVGLLERGRADEAALERPHSLPYVVLPIMELPIMEAMRHPDDLLDRTVEWEELIRVWQRPRPELVFVTGRRRAGKSHLLVRFARATGGIYYQATKRTEQEQLTRLSAMVGEHFADAALRRGVPFPDWEALLAYLSDRAGSAAFLLVLDEFPYLSAAAPALPSIVQSLWDQRWPGTRFKLVLSGSHITAMRQLEEADQPLYGRRTCRLQLEPFGYADAADFLPGYSARDRLRAWGIFGGLPGQLAVLNPGMSLEQNVAEQLLSPSGRLLDEAQHLLDAFLADAQVHYSIIEAVAQGAHTWNEITKRVGREGGSLSRAVQWLIAMGLLARVAPITERNPAKSKRAIYRISDPYLAFWHRFISPLVSAGSIGLAPPSRLWEHQVAPRMDDHMGPVFESACRQFVSKEGVLPFAPLRVGEWWDASSDNEIDVVCLGADGELLVGECKWGMARADDMRRLQTRTDLIAREFSGIRRVHLALFSGRGMADDIRAAVDARQVLHFTAEEMFDAQRVTATGSDSGQTELR